MPDASVSTGLRHLSPKEAYALGARSPVIGVASVGGKILDSWAPYLIAALEAKFACKFRAAAVSLRIAGVNSAHPGVGFSCA